MYLYKIVNTESNSVYVGITRTTLDARWRAHKCACKRGDKTPLYDSMRNKGVDKFSIQLIEKCETEEELLQKEKEFISKFRDATKCYNVLDGGTSYFPIKDREKWKTQLKEARSGKKPALGMKHTEENKKLFSDCGKRRWDIYGRYPDDVCKYSFKDASKLFGISKTHYYRLKKLAKTNDLS